MNYKIRQARSEYYSRRINENQGDIKGTWKVLKQAVNRGLKMADISTVNYDSEEVTDKIEYQKLLMITSLVWVRSLPKINLHLHVPL